MNRGKRNELQILILIALALCLCVAVAPVSAYWMNGNWIVEGGYIDYSQNTVVHDPATGVDSKYVATSAFDVIQPIDKMTGTLQGSIRCGYNTLTPVVGIRNDANPDGVNGTFTYFPILPNGKFGDVNGNEGIQLVPGSYTLYLKDGNGGQPEISHATIVANTISNPEIDLLGHAVSGDATHKVVYTILKASYGGEKCEQVVDVPAHDEQVVDVPAHNEYRYVIGGHGEGPWYHRYWVDEWSEWSNNHPSCSHQTRQVPATYKTIQVQTTYKTICSSGTADVTSNVQEAVNKGYTNFLFRNDVHPGGIFDIASTTLLSEIDDPAEGIVKSVYIDYTVDGANKIIDTMEYQQIQL